MVLPIRLLNYVRPSDWSCTYCAGSAKEVVEGGVKSSATLVVFLGIHETR